MVVVVLNHSFSGFRLAVQKSTIKMLPAFVIYAVVRGLHCVHIYATLPDLKMVDLHFYVTNKESLFIWLFSSILQLGFLPLVLAAKMSKIFLPMMSCSLLSFPVEFDEVKED